MADHAQASAPAASWSDQTKKLVFNTVAKGLSPADQALFEAVCLSSGLDPLRKEVYAVSRGGRMSIQTGIDGYLKLANSTRELDGMEVLFYDNEGNESEVWLRPQPPTACLVRVYRKNCQFPFTASCRFDAYSQKNQMWRQFPETMLAKCATTLALRRAFADVISGIASADEMDQSGLAVPEALTQGTPVATAAPKQTVQPQVVATTVKREPTQAKPEAPVLGLLRDKSAADEIVVDDVSAITEPDDQQAEEVLPERDDLTGAVGALYKKSRLVGLSPLGWATLCKQIGGDGEKLDVGRASKALPALADQSKVANLNQGLATTGAKL